MDYPLYSHSVHISFFQGGWIKYVFYIYMNIDIILPITFPLK